MDAMNSPVRTKSSFKRLLAIVKNDFPAIKFKKAEEFRWSAETSTVYYTEDTDNPIWSLLHEIGHMQSNHNVYSSDSGLIRMELEAWEKAKILAEKYAHRIDSDHIEDCMDSYRNWQHKRSTCPVCTQTGIEKQTGEYLCINCGSKWQVTPNRFCRVYRQTKRSQS